jgi:hypothetical protein
MASPHLACLNFSFLWVDVCFCPCCFFLSSSDVRFVVRWIYYNFFLRCLQFWLFPFSAKKAKVFVGLVDKVGCFGPWHKKGWCGYKCVASVPVFRTPCFGVPPPNVHVFKQRSYLLKLPASKVLNEHKFSFCNLKRLALECEIGLVDTHKKISWHIRKCIKFCDGYLLRLNVLFELLSFFSSRQSSNFVFAR